MIRRSPVTFTEGYDLDRKIEDFLAQRSSAVAHGVPSAGQPVHVEFIGLGRDDRRITTLRAAAAQLRLNLRFSALA